MTVKIYQLKDISREVHMVGKYAGVSFPIKSVKKVITQDGTKYVAETWEHDSTRVPYIDFYDIRQGSDGEYYKDEDSPVQGGLSPHEAIVIAIELKQACDYIQNREWEKQ